MLMQNIRRWTKKHRVVITVVVVLLMLGLVASFATWSSPDISADDPSTEPTTDELITAYTDHIADLETNTDLAYNDAQSLAQNYMELSSLYWRKSQEITADPEAEDADAAAAEAEAARTEAENQSIAAAKKADEYYVQAFSLAPEELNEVALGELKMSHAAAKEAQQDYEGALAILDEAQELWPDNAATIIASKAAMHERLGNIQDAADLYVEARDLDPLNVNVAINYCFFLYSNQSPMNAVIEMTEFRDSLPEDSPDLATVNSYLSLFESFAGLNEETDDDTTDDDAGAAGATDDTTGADDNTTGNNVNDDAADDDGNDDADDDASANDDAA